MTTIDYRKEKLLNKVNNKNDTEKDIFFRILHYFLPYWKSMIIILFTIISTSILNIVQPIFTKDIIDIALPKKNIRLLLTYILLSFGTLLISSLVSVGQSYLNTFISKNIIRDLRSDMYENLQSMSIKFFTNVKSGEITSRINNDIGGIEGIFSNTFIQVIQGVFSFVTISLTLFFMNWKLAIISIISVPIFLIPSKKVGRKRLAIATETQVKLAELTNIITETLNISGIMLMNLFNIEKEKNKEFEKINEDVTKLQIRETIVGRWFIMTIKILSSLTPLLIYLFGGLILIKYNNISIGEIVMFVTLVTNLYSPVNTFSNIHVDLVRATALFKRIFQYLDLKSDIADSSSSKIITNIKGNIEFKHVNFSYTKKSNTLIDINFKIESGQTVAFVGASGAGKTTISYLLPRLYDVDSGSIFIDGIDVKDFTLTSLRSHIGMVTQDTFLFNTTIKDNLLFAKSHATDQEIISVCKAANIHDFIISLPDGYNTIVGERGIKLSGGEKQRLSIARTLLKKPSVIIFDEATSALDSNSESLIKKTIDPILKSCTSLIIAHRLSTIISADIIFVLKDGRIIEYGNHLELLKKCSVYKDLYDKQFRLQN
ncbi:ABC transporter ATP-binding protein [Clostridium pasteurianum]|uniref:ABC-type multidrug transport system, ATPase and permease component n=1 Tax=Clostridium pasteurianum BC1 TaxID=86416 RepID=R4KD34_CLOPA|nr:ABC transporter ATP-binding protein [Clostridium pasteurianum]AGK99606.1 ABC-type multidrug transport system, ATPase and permease component [Clostridium pasteurianum BC1]